MSASLLSAADRALLADARTLSRRSVGPTRERAGAIAVTRAGVAFPGVAVCLPASPALSVCAVPAALGAARAASPEPVTTIALWIPATASEQPCGLCLQVWQELAPEARFLFQREADEPQVIALAERLPDPFTRFEPSS